MHIIAGEETRHASRAAAHALCECLVLVLLVTGCQKPDDAPPVAPPEDSPVTTLGSLEVTARLVEVPEGAIFKRDLYHYASVLKYQVLEVHRGQMTESAIYVAQYNPFKPRAEAADQRVPGIGGDLRTFRAGQVQRLALEASVEDHYMGGIVDKYFGQHTGPIYWAVWTNLVRD